MKTIKNIIILSILIVLVGCFSNNTNLSKQKNIRGIIEKLQKSFPEDAPIVSVSLNSCEKLSDNFCDADITYKKGNEYYSVTYYDDTWTKPRECTRTILPQYAQRYKTISTNKMTDFTFDNIDGISDKVYEQLQKEYSNVIDDFALVSVTQQMGLKGTELDLTFNVTKKDDTTRRYYARKRLNGVGKMRRCLVIVKKYYSVYVYVNEEGEINKKVDFSKGNTYEETTL